MIYTDAIRSMGKAVNAKTPDITEDELLNMWFSQFVEKGLVAKGYVGLSEELLVENLHQDGYLDGMFVGYALAVMSMAYK